MNQNTEVKYKCHRRSSKALILIPIFLFTQGCASMFAPGPDYVLVDSDPVGATVKLDGNQVGTTPCNVMFYRKSEGILTLEKAGYKPKMMDVDKVLNGSFLLNIPWFIGIIGPIGMTIDLISSNQGKYSTDPIRMTLEPLPPSR